MICGAAGCGPAIRLVRDGDRDVFRVDRLPSIMVLADTLSSSLAVRIVVDGIDEADLPPISGEYDWFAGTLTFTPDFPLAPGQRYRATCANGLAREFLIPERAPAPPTVVERIHPSSEVLPENLLKFYILFSAPMSAGQAWQHIRLVDQDDREVELAFLEIDEELWDRDRRRLTVLIDPGRIKREVRPLEEVGPALVAGRHYAIVVDAAWEDANGAPLARAQRKDFRAGPPDRDIPRVDAWILRAPRAGTRDALEVTLDEPLDHGLLHSAIGVSGLRTERVDGVAEVADAETTWLFTPSRPWTRGRHVLVVATTLEDLAGNSVGRPFEVDVEGRVQSRVDFDVVRRAFEVQD
jgi:hypothetical protein